MRFLGPPQNSILMCRRALGEPSMEILGNRLQATSGLVFDVFKVQIIVTDPSRHPLVDFLSTGTPALSLIFCSLRVELHTLCLYGTCCLQQRKDEGRLQL